jgi:subtilisin family serine protease
MSVSVRVRGALDDLRALGIRFSGALGEVATAEVTSAQLRLLAAHPAVRSIEASRPLTLNLNASVPDTGITETGSLPFRSRDSDGWTDTSYTGRGVLIGIIDTGVDLALDDFLKPDGATRVLAVWDQSSSVGRPPRGFSYGAECTAAQIDARDCPEVDRDGHGTHVAGIAAGNGSATGHDQPAYQYTGMAPEADLLVVKLRAQTTTRVIDALDYLRRKAVALGKPIAVNLSLGSPLGPHDGTTDLEQAINEFSSGVALTNPDRTLGAVVVASAGNSGQDRYGTPLHAVGCFQATTACPPELPEPGLGTQADVSFVVPGNVPDQPDTVMVSLDVWYPGSAVLGVTVTQPTSGCSAGPVSLNGSTFVNVATSCGTIVISAGNTQQNGDRRTSVVITHATRVTPGIWTLSISADATPDTTRFDVWSDSSPVDNRIGFSSMASRETTIETPASALEAIAVVPFISKTVWTSIDPTCSPCTIAQGTLHNLLPVASRGPLRPCTSTTNPSCTDSPQKPELAAPGAMIMSSFSARVPDDPALDKFTDPDRRHYVLAGSSMAAPHVTGAAALLLQINPRLTAQQVKTRLLATAAYPGTLSSPTPAAPYAIAQWGSGLLAVNAAVAALRAAPSGDSAGTDPTPAEPTGLRVTSVGSRRVAMAWNDSQDLDLKEYHVLRRAEGDPPPVIPYRILAPTVTTFNDSDPENLGVLQNETAYYYSVQAVDIASQTGAPSEERRAVPTAGDGSVGLCFIATAAYGSAWHPHVASLRRFRDERLRPFATGRAAISLYETVSPPIAAFIAPHPSLRAMTRGALAPAVFAVEHPRMALALISLFLLGTATITLRRRAS